jgi:hypothetical protein
MTLWAPPIYAREVVNKAACVLVTPEDHEYENDFEIISNWRTAHSFPLNTCVEKAAIEGKSGLDAVLVSVESVKALKQAYPNYFLDTHRFLDAVEIATRDRTVRVKSAPPQGSAAV